METILLKSAPLKIDFIKKPTKAKFFKYLEVGDVFTVESKLKSVGRSSNGLYASKITFTCTKSDGATVSDTMTANQAMNCLDNFEISNYE